MLDYRLFKKINDLFASGQHDKARHLLMEVQSRCIALRDEVSMLKIRLKTLEDTAFLAENLHLKDGVFFALLVLQGPDGRVRVDCRPSDAIALAMRAEAPIMVNEDVLRRAAEAQEKAEQRLNEEVLSPVPDAATDMVRKAGARKEADMLHSQLLRGTALPDGIDPEEDRRFREMLRSLEPISRRKM